MSTNIEILKSLTAEQLAEAVNDMRNWFKDCQWEDIDEEDINNMSDEELLRGIERHYYGGLNAFIKANKYFEYEATI